MTNVICFFFFLFLVVVVLRRQEEDDGDKDAIGEGGSKRRKWSEIETSKLI